MRKSIKILSLLFTIVLIFIGVACKDDTTKPSDSLAAVKEKVSALSIPATVNSTFSDIALYQSDVEGVTVTYTLSTNAEGYLKVEEYTLSFVALPATNITATLTANITSSSASDSVVFNISLVANPALPVYSVSVTAINGRKIAGALVTYTENGTEVVQGETNNEGIYEASLDAYAYDVTVYLPSGFVFENGTDTYETKADRNATPIEVECIPALINDEAPANTTYSTGDQLYDFTLADTYDPISGTWGNSFNLAEELAENELVVINFWYSTCSWCLTEFPLLVNSYSNLVADGAKIKVIGITYSAMDDKDSVRQAALNYGLNFNLAIDDNMVTQFQVTGFPTTVFIDRYGTADYIESGAITTASRWDTLFSNYLGDTYVPEYKGTAEDGGSEPVIPDVAFPDSSELEAILNKDGFTATYTPETSESDAEYSWPFVPSTDEEGAVIPANQGVDESYATMYVNVELAAGQAFAFDYKASCEEDMDILYLVYDSAIIAQFSGVQDEYTSFYPFVAAEAGTYSFAFVYLKDKMASDGDDGVYLKNFRYVDPNEIPETLFVIREASNDLDILNGGYKNYITPVYNENDGYYHVNEINGPLLLADLMSASHFSNETILSYAEAEMFDGEIDGTSINDLVVRYCQYAVNSLTQGYTPVNNELREVLEAIADQIGTSMVNKDNQWLEMTVYYNVYGQIDPNDERINHETGQITDPTVGLAHHNAIPVEVNDIPGVGIEDDTKVAEVEYTMNRFITTRGFYFKFVPEYSGVYLVYGVSGQSNDCYIEDPNYATVAQANFEIRDYYHWATDDGILVFDFNLYAYLEAGKTYYICPFPSSYGEYGDVSFAITYLSEEYVVLEKASSAAYTTSGDFTQGDTSDIENMIISVGIDVALGEDGYYHELYSDGSMSKDPIMFDFLYQNMLINMTFADALAKDKTAFDMTKNDFGEDIIDSEGYLIEWGYRTDANGNAIADEDGNYIRESHYVLDANGQKVKADTTLYKDWTAIVQEWYNTDLIQSTDEKYGSANGCLAVTEEVKTLLELLMNKYSFKDVEGSWLKLCYYYKYYGASEHSSDVYSPSV